MKYKRAVVRFGYIAHPTVVTYGMCWPGEIVIDLKFSKVNPIYTMLHEQLHLIHPQLSETKIKKLTTKTWKKMTQKEVFELGKRMLNRKFSKEEE